jgi:hypothetical protein
MNELLEDDKEPEEVKKLFIPGLLDEVITPKEKKQPRKRVHIWEDTSMYDWEIQKNLLHQMYHKTIEDVHTANARFVLHEIRGKLSGYRQQDLAKSRFDPSQFITVQHVLEKLQESGLLCIYCQEPMYVIYDTVRESKQWSVDRIDNTKGHNQDNFHVACLDCNLKRRRRNDQHFLFTKQLKLVKVG